ncbi:MAG: hypothetical protein V1837_06490 [Candidatus Woesearchaeota archaeon]
MRATIIIFTIFILALSVPTYAWINDGQPHWECLHKGDKLIVFECKYDTCSLCQKSGYTKPSYWCSGIPMSCTYTPPGENNTIDVQPPVINVSSPVNNAVYSGRSVPFNIRTNEISNIAYLNNIDPRRGYSQLCTNCKTFSKVVGFSDGLNNITIRVTDKSGNSAYKTVVFTVDSKKPVIKGILPKAGVYTNGQFSIKYDEENLVRITLVWKGISGVPNQVAKTNCPKGIGQTCNFTVTGLPQGAISFYFKVQDVAQEIQSSEISVLVDTVAPVITRISPQPSPYAEKAVLFDLTISEPVTLTYIDNSIVKPVWKPLCTKCSVYGKKVSFGEGNHTVTIKAVDPAGNVDTEYVSFFVDSLDPKIKKMLPKDKSYANGQFSVDVEDLNLKVVILHYTESGSTEKQVQKSWNDCSLNNKLYTCTFNPTLTVQGLLTYYFEVRDIATTVESKVFTETVDTIAPILAVYSPSKSSYIDRNIKFNVSISEPVTLDYTDLLSSTPKYMTLCQKCTKYIGSKPLSLGAHSLVIRATDPAGNVNEVTRSFTIGP